MAKDFPNSPSVNDTTTIGGRTYYYTADGKWALANTSSAVTAAFAQANAPVYVSTSAPASPIANSLWWNSKPAL